MYTKAHRKASKKLYDKRKRLGLCTRCGKKKEHDERGINCDSCSGKINKYRRDKY